MAGSFRLFFVFLGLRVMVAGIERLCEDENTLTLACARKDFEDFFNLDNG